MLLQTEHISNTFVMIARQVGRDDVYVDKLKYAGVSPAFVARVMWEDRHEILNDWLTTVIAHASELGELYCVNCDEFYNYTEAIPDSRRQHLCCPTCQGPLEVHYCSLCGRQLAYDETVVLLDGYLCCQACAAAAQQPAQVSHQHQCHCSHTCSVCRCHDDDPSPDDLE